ncbi:diphosphate--fructose-6-phosphate 1-phosphotransferase [Lentisphaerota bacterium WC36G]|nr:diphosphate--fructose-6-phosphate 1-phosphotransferase [Lentisphaerae bacterium WC36]
MTQISALETERLKYQPKLPPVLRNGANVAVVEGEATTAVADADKIAKLFAKTFGGAKLTFSDSDKIATDKPLNVGVILSGGQAPGGHNVIAGLFDGIKSINADSKLFGFLNGPDGLVQDRAVEITAEFLADYRNTGGFDIIGSGRTKLESQEQFEIGKANCEKRGITNLVIIGGDDSNTNACLLAEYYAATEAGINVVGCPKTIDGDLKNEQIETSFGFDTCCRVYSELIGNIQRDANSAKKYWHFIKLMGRSASHIGLECALQTQPNAAIISEEVAAKAMTLDSVVSYLADIVKGRAANGENFGVALIPEGLIEFIPEVKALISELNDLLAHENDAFQAIEAKEDKIAFILERLSADSKTVFASLPQTIQIQLSNERDPHGNVQVSLVETEKLLAEMVATKLKSDADYTGKFATQTHFFGYEGRCAAPSNYDADYCYSLGYTAAALLGNGKTGYMSSVTNTINAADEWSCGGVPITMMMNMERRHGEDKPVIQKALVKLDDAPFKAFAAKRDEWAVKTSYVYPGPIQYFGPSCVCDLVTKTLELEQTK